MLNEMAAHRVLAPALAQLAALADDPHITRTAACTGISQPTLSRSIRRWEQQLGVPLLEPDGRGVRLTPEAVALAGAAAEAIHLLDDAMNRIRGRATPNSLTLGFLKSLGPTVVAELIASFLREDPRTVVAHREGSSSELVHGIDDGTIDVAIIAPRPVGPYEWLRLGRQSFALVVPVGHRLAAANSASVGDVRDEPVLALDRRFDARRRADALCASAGFTPHVALEADDITTIRGYVGSGLGVAILPADTATAARTVDVPIQAPNAWREFGIAWRPERLTRTGEALLAHARHLSARYPDWADIVV
ncbi:LysR family transcriptional regulator [Micromonospora sp. NPDC047707]|uniref:LysR family transcriptional regulator n=1 Tax=Micromonospora sp. NPDC047707 TaxID=3154498 RepID=UPI003454BF4E